MSLLPDVYLDSSLTACSGVESTAAPQKLLILDARSYTAAVANRAKGGGCECEGIAVTPVSPVRMWFGGNLCSGKKQSCLELGLCHLLAMVSFKFFIRFYFLTCKMGMIHTLQSC